MAADLSGLRERVLELYGLDIAEAERHFSTHNYAFVFPGSPFMVRVNVGATKPREEALSEVLWLDDLKAFSETICEPAPSRAGRLVEECTVDGQSYRISMFRTAKGSVKDPIAMEPLDVICVGDLLGRIHQAGADALAQGIRYSFHSFGEGVDRLIAQCRGKVAPEVHGRMETIHGEVRALPRDPAGYGLLHGDFHSANFFMDGHNVWVFDFDNAVYGHYLYDIAECIYETWLLGGYRWPKPRREVLEEDVLPYFRQGYEFHHELPEGSWELLPLFIREHAILPVASLSTMPAELLSSRLEAYLEDFAEILMADDVFAATDAVLRVRREAERDRRGEDAVIEVVGEGTAIGKDDESVSPATEGGADRAIEIGSHRLVFEGPSGEGRATLRLGERLDTNNSDAVTSELMALVDAGALRGLTVDGTGLAYLSSAGIRTFVRLLKALGGLRLAHLSDGVREVLEVTGVADLPGIEFE